MSASRTLLNPQGHSRKKITAGQPFGRTIFETKRDGVEIRLHATKGWRRQRVGQ